MTLGFIGCGKMGEAILESLVRAHVAVPQDILVAEVDATRRTELHARYGVRVCAGPTSELNEAEVLVLAVKPQGLDDVLREVATWIQNDTLVISIAAGKRLAGMETLLPGCPVVRVMPNLAALVSQSMNVFCAGQHVTAAVHEKIESLLACFGVALELPEDQFDAVTALSGSGPAFVAFYLKAMIKGAIEAGLEPEAATRLAIQMLRGTAELFAEGLYDPDSLIAAVSSAKGTTVAGMDVLRGSSVRDTVCQALNAAARRSRELSAPPAATGPAG